jgi:electron transfer flavoprotein beta subunit
VAPALVAACVKWVDLRPDIDPLTAGVAHDPRSFGWSAADHAALEWALRLGEAWGVAVNVLTAGPSGAEVGLRRALAAGAAAAVRVDLPTDAPSPRVARALAGPLRRLAIGATGDGSPPVLVCCGDWSVDRGSGSTPAFLAAELGATQALGLVGVQIDPSDPGRLRVERRLDRGRRERLEVGAPAVLSVEGGTALLRRASLPAVLAAEAAPLTVVGGPVVTGADAARTGARTPFRPRPRGLAGPDPAAPAEQRVLALTGALVDRSPPRTVRAEPEEAAGIILDQLRMWGYRP